MNYPNQWVRIGEVLTEWTQEYSDKFGLDCSSEGLPSLTDQSSKEEADINVLMRRFGFGEELPANYRPPLDVDFVDIFDYQSARNALIEAERKFMEMPAELRGRFENDPQKVIEFIADPANLDEVIKLGLAPPKKKVEEAPKA